MPDTLPLDSDITIEVDDTFFIRRAPLRFKNDKVQACDTLPLDSDITIEVDDSSFIRRTPIRYSK